MSSKAPTDFIRSIKVRLVSGTAHVGRSPFSASTCARVTPHLRRNVHVSNLAPPLTTTRPRTLQGKTVLVKTNSGSDFKGILHCLDGFLNIALEHCEEWSNGECRRTYGDAFIRGNNVTFISLIGK